MLKMHPYHNIQSTQSTQLLTHLFLIKFEMYFNLNNNNNNNAYL